MAKSVKPVDKNTKGKNQSTEKKIDGKFGRISSPPPKPTTDKKKDK